MRVLWVTSQNPRWHGGAGCLLELELLRGAAERHDVHVIAPRLAASKNGDDEPPLDDVRALGISVETVPWRQRPEPRVRAQSWWINAVRMPPYGLWRFTDRQRQLGRALRRAEARHKPDLVHVTLGEIAEVTRVASAPSALLLFDVYVRQLDREIEHTTGRKNALWRYQRRRMESWERRAYKEASAIATVTEEDAAEATEILGRSVTVIPNPVADEFFETPTVTRSNHEVVFVGTLDYRPNVDAIQWFVDHIWESVREQVPEARLVVVGRSPAPEVAAAVERAGGTLHPDVPDVRPYYWSAAVAIAPVRLGSGLRNKLLHSFATQTPLVATSTALEGIRARPDDHVLVADTTEAFAAAVVANLQDPAAARARAANALAVVDGLRYEKAHEHLDDWWRGAVASRP
jgi:polysaccharide biosynthesis protein PslH